MKRSWQMQEAKNKLSEVIDKARTEGPQTITRHGESTVVVVDYQEFQRMRQKSSAPGLAEFFAKSPLRGISLEIARDKNDFGRKNPF